MSTELDLYALRQMTPLQCAQRLTVLSCAELWAVCTYLCLRVKGKAEKADLVGAITLHLHPRATLPVTAAEGQQLSLF